MPADQANLRVVLRRIERISILKGEAVAVVDESIAVWHIMHEERPKDIPNHDRIYCVLMTFDNVVKGLQRVSRWIVGGPVIFSYEIGLVDAGYQFDVLVELSVIGRVVMVGEDVNLFDVEMSLVDAIGAVDDKFVGSELLNIGLFPISCNIRKLRAVASLQISQLSM